MTTYITISGDTFESIARKKYGTEQESSRIRKANPGVVEPLSTGVSVIIPPSPNQPKDQPQNALNATPEEVAVLIDGVRFRFWTEVQIVRSLDSMDTIQFSAPFEADAPGFKEAFQPLTYKPTTVTVGGEPFFTGTIINPLPVIDPEQKTISVDGYSTPGVLGDCNQHSSSYPENETNKQGLEDIAKTLCDPFGISVVFIDEPGPPLERVAISPNERVLSYLVKLAKQDNLIINSTEKGELRFIRPANVGKPVAVLQQGEPPIISITPFINAQNFYSHITGMLPTLTGFPGVASTVKNPFLTGVTRPYTFTVPDVEGANVQKAAQAKIGHMFANAVSYAVKVNTWRDPSGVLWTPDTTIKLTAPDAMVYDSYEFTIRSISFNKSSTSETATLNLILPGVLAGKIPESLPWL